MYRSSLVAMTPPPAGRGRAPGRDGHAPGLLRLFPCCCHGRSPRRKLRTARPLEVRAVTRALSPSSCVTADGQLCLSEPRRPRLTRKPPRVPDSKTCLSLHPYFDEPTFPASARAAADAASPWPTLEEPGGGRLIRLMSSLLNRGGKATADGVFDFRKCINPAFHFIPPVTP